MKASCPIVVVDDSEMNQSLTFHQLRVIGFDDVKLFSNGADALDWLAENACALVLTDCKMPLMNGFEMTRRIRHAEKDSGTHMHIIASTADASIENQRLCFAAGMDDCLVKPTQLVELQALMLRWAPKDLA